MPTEYIKSVATKLDMSVPEVESYWDKAKAVAKKSGKEEDYAYITGIFKNMLKLESFTSYRARSKLLN